MAKKLITYSKDATADNIVDDIMVELFSDEGREKDTNICVMDEKEYYNKLGEKTGRELNAIITAVQTRTAKEDAGLKDEVEEWFFDSLVKEAEEHVKKYGGYPVFELFEID